MEAERVSACLGATEAAWLRKLWGIFDPTALDIPVNLCVDNQAIIYFANMDVAHTKAKHIDLKYYYIKAHVNDGTIIMWHVPSKINPADIFTKPLRADHHLELMQMLGLRRFEEVC